jgi:superfamily I DNA/RNA helicase/RecB family exonuclease
MWCDAGMPVNPAAEASPDRGQQRVRIVAPRAAGTVPVEALDPVQAQAVARSRGSGPLILFGAPGTGKTTILVEAVVTRVERDGVPPDAVLVLAATRTAAAALRDRICARLARTLREPLARTPHSYAFGLLRRARVLDGDPPPRLISGPEQDAILAELLAGHEEGLVELPPWPASIGPEIRALRGFRDELRDLLMRALERGLGPDDLAHLGRRHDRPDWVAAAHVLGEYLDVTALASPGAYDPAGIVDAAAVLLAEDEELRAAEHECRRLVIVDDAHEATVATHRLLDQLVGGGRDLLLAGDPDSATQAFRGARPQLLAQVSRRWPKADGTPADVLVLPTAHRQPERLRAVTARVAERIGSAGVVAHRKARSPGGPGGSPPGAALTEEPVGTVEEEPVGTVEVHLLASAAQEAAYVAGRLRRLHLTERLAWSAMAVVVRSARGTEPLRRALSAAGVPVAVPPAELPLRDEPAVVPLRLALRIALNDDALTPDIAVELLAGPLGGVDAVGLRRLRQGLRALELAGGGGRSSDVLLVEALRAPGTLLLLDPVVARGARRVVTVVDAGRRAASVPGATAETVLWELWQASGLAEAWRRTALAGGTAGTRADRDLDAVLALFEAAARYVDRMPHASPAGFLEYLEGQEIPADTLAERAPDDDAVALVTAQGAAGREWDVVAVAGVQEGTWPDLRLRSSLLGAQNLADLVDGRASTARPATGAEVSAGRRAVLDDELRGFHVAVSRARRHLVVTAVRSQDELPSPFLDLVEPPPDDADGRELTEVPRAMTLPALVAELRAVLLDAAAPPARVRTAAGQLAVLARSGVPGADPDQWYGLPDLSTDAFLRPPDEPVAVSPSKVEQYHRCPLRWMVETAGGTKPSSTSQTVGTLVHELAQLVPDGDPERLVALLEARMARLGLGDGWVAERERERVRRMVAKFAEYVRRNRRELVAVEQDVQVEVGRAVIRGKIDRLERDADGRLVVVDLKTGATAPPKRDLDRHPQLGSYQLTVAEGGFDTVAPGARTPGGAELVQLGTATKSPSVQSQTSLADDDDPDWARTLVQQAADGMGGAVFPAVGNGTCRVCAVSRVCPLQPEGRQVGE